MFTEQEMCDIVNCKNEACGKQILIQDYGNKKWMANVCQKHYDAAHPSRKQNE